MIESLLLATEWLAQDQPRDTGPDFGKASPFGLLIVAVLLVAVFLLVWSMNRHLKRLPESFDPEHPEPDQAVDDGTVDLGTVSGTDTENGNTRRESGG
ncbi:hypothetical protein [Mycolicibacterium litorale]|uniref:Uncharacterized protein n=1 Tax=Mycolicibacterium litorale TaxID=758802 RepID=A0AAD1IFY6_9MYCO|nr:hypothetical protein [Mycolicibacterium litorale]MCV7418663.1 hypothetical protein [Mycolicibacterium litorale]TDY05939.1 hypothetical protein BCL50_2250 [Mycolicibacterium litorale]BBY14555.1 hypothetical protein MLIT_01470 [Mycolicibacterium litorale]